ncbi:hypothetical protein QTH90_31370 [Variovorax sp. J2P1-59]|uniref:hypothetical protein n=1 Tax=Variovorax flavidus TaxID=3053501 RepID=UPI002574EC63|nr:hypothetical protein [Variovorax sp. J2P1-59]MDM0078942.1 hypothetical protein [Variovorax sp. J2P1-59]
MIDAPLNALPSLQVPASEAGLHLVPDPALGAARGWPPVCSLAELGRMLTMMHGHEAPTESSLKKWSASGEFTTCGAPEQSLSHFSLADDALRQPRRGGRPGLRLDTRLAIRRVYELWPHLTDTGSQAVLDLAVARATENLESRLTHLIAIAPAPSPSVPAGPEPEAEILGELLRQVVSLRQEMAEVKREVAQFSAMRNNLITKLDDAVARAQEAIAVGSGRSGSGSDPLVEARRDRDMGVVKSMLSEILSTLDTENRAP